MRTVVLGLLFALVLVAACTSAGDDDDVATTPTASPTPTATPPIVIQSVSRTVAAGQELVECYYTSIASATDVNVGAIEASLDAGLADVILYRTATPNQPDGTQQGCSGGGAAVPLWVFAAYTSNASIAMPAGVALPMRASQPVFLRLHFLNLGATPIDARATVTLSLVSGTVQHAGTLTTYDGNISIPPMSTGHVVTDECDTPDGVSFFAMSTHTHKLAVSSRANRFPGGELLVESTDWENPTVATWSAPWLTFTTGEKLAYTCTYDNPGNTPVTDGDSSQTDEVCMTVSYFFPATANYLCYSSFSTSYPF